MLIIMTSPDAVLRSGRPDPQIAKVLTDFRAANNPVALVSNHREPVWFAPTFKGSSVQFLQVIGRQSGEIISTNAKKFSLAPHDVLVLAAKDEDVQMGKNGGAVLIAAGWGTSRQVTSLGIRVDDAKQLQEVIGLTKGWPGQWWFSATGPQYGVRALADLSQYGKDLPQQLFAQKLTQTVKQGGSRLNALLAVTARSLLTDGVATEKDLLWGVYPSSSSTNQDDEILSDFTQRLRTTVSRVRFAKVGEPLFIRHRPSIRRSGGGGGDRTDPTDQLLTLHLNPFYRDSGRLVGKRVIVIDDCTTYGASFGVAAALLRKAGAVAVTGVALGKFGSQLRAFDIDVLSNPYAPLAPAGFNVRSVVGFSGSTSVASQRNLLTLIP
jgi:hypothetical protein